MAVHHGGRGPGHTSRWPKAAGPPSPSIQLSASTVAEDAATNTVIGALSVVNHPSGSSGWTFAITSQTPSGKLNISSANLRTNAALDYEANPTLSVTITASKSAQSDIVQVLTISVTNVLEVTLGTLSLSATSYATSAPASGTINGASSGSIIAATGLPAGLTIDGPNRTWAWDGTGAISTGNLTLTETHVDGANSPNATVIAWSITNVVHDGHLLADNNDHLTADNGDYLLAA